MQWAHAREAGGHPCAATRNAGAEVPPYAVDPYLIARMAGQHEEMLLCLFYDREGAFRAEQAWVGDWSSVAVDRRGLMQVAMVHEARYVVMAHNHPSGEDRPSAQDIETTRTLHRLFAAVGVCLVDHAIIAKDVVPFSFRRAGLI